ncbi:MAG TPA: ATP-binding cassette domain-containing protein [Acidimicrobiia bacterium]|nr:ATP-binding cassette domain-containing protein [Acidimicrobiia bacterium]
MLSVQELHKSFGDVQALTGCNFEVGRGQMLGFLGPNGAGKTTAMRTIFRLIRPDSGTVTWDGDLIEPDDLLRFGYMPEQRGLYPKMRAGDQLTYFGRLHGMSKVAARDAAVSWLERFGLRERMADSVETLSHGNQQRVQLAAALIHDPELLVLDEPFGGLDPIAVETMSDVLREQAAMGKAVLFSSHQLDLVEDLCEEVAIIDAGAVVVRGNVERLKDAAPIRHVELEAEGDPSELLDFLDGVHSTQMSGDRLTAIISAETGGRGFVAHVQQQGRLRHFTYTTPSLSDLFREAVRRAGSPRSGRWLGERSASGFARRPT